MRFRLGLVTGLATGYYLGARAGRQRYDQINRAVGKLRRSELVQSAVEEATEKARAVVEEKVEQARSAIDHRGADDRTENGHGSDITGGDITGIDVTGSAPGIILPGSAGETGAGGYSSSR